MAECGAEIWVKRYMKRPVKCQLHHDHLCLYHQYSFPTYTVRLWKGLKRRFRFFAHTGQQLPEEFDK